MIKARDKITHTNMLTFSPWVGSREDRLIGLYISEEQSKEGTCLITRFIHKIKAKL